MPDIDDQYKTIGQVLKKIRRSRGLSRRSVAAQCGMSTQGIWYLEHNEDSHFQTVRKVCRVLKVSLDKVSKMIPAFVPNEAPPRVYVGRPTKFDDDVPVKSRRPAA